MTDPSAEATFEAIYNSTKDDIARYLLRRCADPADAADVAAETFIVVWRKISDLPPANQIRPWAFGIARRVLSNHRRSDHTRSRLALRLEQHLKVATSDTPRAEGPDPASHALETALARLTEIDRELLTLVVWDGLSSGEAAIAVGISAGAARVRLHRARQRIRADLDAAIVTTQTGCTEP